MWLWVLIVVSGGVGITVGINLLMNRLGIRPVDPASRPGGLRDVAQKVNTWSARRRAGHEERKRS